MGWNGPAPGQIGIVYTQGIEVDNGINRVKRPVAPLPHLGEDVVRDPADEFRGYLYTIDVLQVRLDVPDGYSAGIQCNYLLIENRQPLLVFWHENRCEFSIPITGDIELDLLVSGKHLLVGIAVAIIACKVP